MERAVRIATAGLALAAFVTSSPSAAQGIITDVIGQTVGNMVAQGRESSCQAGTLLAEADRIRVEARADDLMAQYVTLAVNPHDRAVSRLFAMGDTSVSWMTPEGQDGRQAMRAWFADRSHTDEASRAPPGPLTRLSLVVAQDGASARGVWEAIPADPGAPHVLYAVDFINNWYAWRIWHMQTYDPAHPPPPTAPYCHFGQANAAADKLRGIAPDAASSPPEQPGAPQPVGETETAPAPAPAGPAT